MWCPIRAEAALEGLPGLLGVRVNIQRGELTVIQEPGPLAREEIAERLQARGFEVQSLLALEWHFPSELQLGQGLRFALVYGGGLEAAPMGTADLISGKLFLGDERALQNGASQWLPSQILFPESPAPTRLEVEGAGGRLVATLSLPYGV